ncbi:MAG: DUF1553 domain-containing protein [Planctomycetes bacterium]|nr:DUF1553 domain-containing protein [Planctomycetota bacterium]
MLQNDRVIFALIVGSLWGWTTYVLADDTLTILPETVSLSGPYASQRLLVEELKNGQFFGQVTKGVTFGSSDLKVVRVKNGVAFPVGNGEATLTAKFGKRTVSVSVKVDQQESKKGWSFRNHVQSVLAKTGCNSGACHGAASGKNGFKLSLSGYNPQADFQTITRQSRGRRVVPSDPGRSLLLTKPTGAIPHKGGVRFEVDSQEYRVLSDWIAAGHPGPRDDDPRMTRLEVLPKSNILKRNATQQMIVLAYFSDGHVEDVTRWVKYSSTNLSVAKIDDLGKVNVIGHGEGAIVAWYLSTNVIASLTVPYETKIDDDLFAKAKRTNFIDDLVLDKLKALRIPPSPAANDAEFLRRAYLDTIGVLPTIEETQTFLAETSPGKREKLIDSLLSRPEFVDYWTYKWSDLLLLSGNRLRPKALESYYKWIRSQVKENTPWNEFARQIVTAKGSTFSKGAANFFALHEDPLDMAETVSMAFLGMSINCARCHDHPLEKWTNDQYYGLANMFSRVRGKGWGGDSRSGDGNRVIFTATAGELIQPRTGKAQPPRPLDGAAVAFDSTLDRRIPLADWLTAPENPYFSKAIVNRVWANFLGVGIVENVDDLRLTNPPSNVALFDALADYLVKNEYDLKALMRLILTSQTYQRSSQSVPGNEADERFYSRYYPKRLKAEVLLDAFSQVADAPTKFPDYPDGTRALQLRDTAVASYFLSTFGRPERIITCDCERSDEPSMTQVLHIMNGETLNEKLSRKADEKKKTKINRIGQLLAEKTPNEKIIDEAYLSALCRLPNADEKANILKILSETEPKEKRLVIEDLYWSILSSKEFLFNH